jgi:hypothetical protein
LEHLSDSTGIVQHAIYTIPDHAHGYCTDDNARALILTVLLEEQGKDSPRVHSLASRYAAFLNVAFNRDTGRFRNFMSFERHWLEEDGSDDSQGRALWTLIFPFSPTETNGIEDARFVHFHNDDGSSRYYATYSAYDGRMVLPQLLETKDFLRCKMHTLNGPAVSNKGMALFPRKINGH